MKKSLFFVAALLLSSMAFAELEKLEINTSAQALGERLGWTTTQYYLVAKLDGNITLRVDTNKNNPSSNCGYYSADTPKDWRMYQARVDSFWLEASNGALIDSVQLSYNNTNGGTLSSKRGKELAPEFCIASDSLLYVGGQSKVCLYIGSTLNKTSGQVRISNFRIIYRGEKQKEDPTFKFANTDVHKKITTGSCTNPLTNTSDGAVSFESSEPSVATVDNNGLVTFVGEGETTITANVAASQNFNAATASYNLTLHGGNWNMETFEGAENVDLTTTSYYLTTVSQSFKASEMTGLKWTTFLGSVRDGAGNFINNAAVVRQRKSTESDMEPGYIFSDSISGGIDSLSFRWNSNGTETGNWNIAILINNDTIGAITEAAGAKQAAGKQFTYSIGNLKREGKFVLRFINLAPVSTGEGNTKRFCVDNIVWYSYTNPTPSGCASIEQEASKAQKVLRDGKLYIYKDGKYINVLGM